MKLFQSHSDKELKKITEEILEEKLASILAEVRDVLNVTTNVNQLKAEIESLKIDKSRREEEYARIERELIHKIGLEKKRQEVEFGQLKKEAKLDARTEHLETDKQRHEEQMRFLDERFTIEVGYLKDMMSKMMEQLPKANLVFRKEEISHGEN